MRKTQSGRQQGNTAVYIQAYPIGYVFSLATRAEVDFKPALFLQGQGQASQ